MEISGMIVDINNHVSGGDIFPGTIVINEGRIAEIRHDDTIDTPHFIMPGLIDSHVHIESSLMVPSEFARLAVRHGTVGAVSDPHEIANVLGLEGVHFMLRNAEQVPFYFFFGASPCVPATSFETSGAELSLSDIEELFRDDRIKYLSEVMNWPGVLNGAPDIMAKVNAALSTGRVVDGHAPGLRGEEAYTYVKHGITTDHECYILDEAREKMKFGMKIQIRQGSAAKNFAELHPILKEDPNNVMFCTDDAHPDFLAGQHIDFHVRESIRLGYDFFDVLRVATKNPIAHYKLPVGLLRRDDSADFIIVDNLKDFHVLETWIKGRRVFKGGNDLLRRIPVIPVNNFQARTLHVQSIARYYEGMVRVIVAHDGSLVTTEEAHHTKDQDVLKLVVVNRYADAPPAVAYVKGFQLSTGALASSVAHDSHNIIAVGVSDQDIVNAVNGVIAARGGLAFAWNNKVDVLELPVAGLMSSLDAFSVVHQYCKLNQSVKDIGCSFEAPFMALSFMALLVIPNLKLSDKGLFDCKKFKFVETCIQVENDSCPTVTLSKHCEDIA